MQTAVSAILLILAVTALARFLWSLRDRMGWHFGARPDAEAAIKSVKSEKVLYAGNDLKFKTTVEFEDGFYYITHDTKRQDDEEYYTITLPKEMKMQILEKAVNAHRESCRGKS